MSCPHCADTMNRGLACRRHILQLLALVEHADALPPESALRVASEILALLGQDATGLSSQPHAGASHDEEAAA